MRYFAWGGCADHNARIQLTLFKRSYVREVPFCASSRCKRASNAHMALLSDPFRSSAKLRVARAPVRLPPLHPLPAIIIRLAHLCLRLDPGRTRSDREVALRFFDTTPFRSIWCTRLTRREMCGLSSFISVGAPLSEEPCVGGSSAAPFEPCHGHPQARVSAFLIGTSRQMGRQRGCARGVNVEDSNLVGIY